MKTANAAAGSKKSGEAVSRPEPDSPSVLLDLRTSWLADNAPNTSRKPAKPKVRLGDKLEIIAQEFLRLLARLKAIPRALAGVVKRSCDGIGERAADAVVGAPGLVILFGFVIVMGALLYATTVQHIFDRGASLGSGQSDLPRVASAKSSSQTQDTATKLGSDSGSNALLERAVAHFDKLADMTDTAALPKPAALANAADSFRRNSRQYEPVAPAPGMGKVLDWADSGSSAKAASMQPLQVESATQKIPDGGAAELRRTQGITATGRQGDAGVTAQRPVAHDGGAAFEVRHFDVAAAAWHPAHIVVTATAVAFLPEGPCETGELMIPLKAIRSVQVGQSGSDKSEDLLNIEVGGQKSGSSMRRLRLSSPLPNAGATSTAQQLALLTNIRQAILAAQGRL